MKAVLLVLDTYRRGRDGRTFPSQRDIGLRACLGRQAVHAALHALEAAGLVAMVSRGVGHSLEYRVNEAAVIAASSRGGNEAAGGGVAVDDRGVSLSATGGVADGVTPDAGGGVVSIDTGVSPDATGGVAHGDTEALEETLESKPSTHTPSEDADNSLRLWVRDRVCAVCSVSPASVGLALCSRVLRETWQAAFAAASDPDDPFAAPFSVEEVIRASAPVLEHRFGASRPRPGAAVAYWVAVCRAAYENRHLPEVVVRDNRAGWERDNEADVAAFANAMRKVGDA